MIENGKCLNCWNEIYILDCHFQCPHCGYAENWNEEPTYQLDKEKNNGQNMPKMSMQHNSIRGDRDGGPEEVITESKVEVDREW